MQNTFKPLVFSGVQPTGQLHLGNYLGAIKRFVQLQQSYPCLFCVVDLHAITLPHTPAELHQSTLEVACAFIACGIDPKQHIIFNQSQVSGHSELAWIFNCVARLGWLNRMTQFKDKAGKDRENASVGLFAYPNLMAADILLYKATHVPVGEDQKQHLELSRDIAQKFNNDFSTQFFPLPEPLIGGPAARVMSLRDGSKKMSKSDPSDYSRINLTDNADTIALKIRKAKTDTEPLPEDKKDLEVRPEADNLLSIYAALMDIEKQAAIETFAGVQFSNFKKELVDVAVAKLEPITKRMQELMQDKGEITNILKSGSERANVLATQNMKELKDILGFVQ